MSRNKRTLGGIVLGLAFSILVVPGAFAAETVSPLAHPTLGESDAPLAVGSGVLNGVDTAVSPAQGTATATPTATETASPTDSPTPSGGVNAGFGGADESGGLSLAMLVLGALVVTGGIGALVIGRRAIR
jgi:hypothetical protein